MYRLIVTSPSQRTTNRPWKGRGYVTWHVLNFWGPIHISGMAEARALKFCTKGDHIKSCLKDDKSPLKGARFCSRDPFFMRFDTIPECDRHTHRQTDRLHTTTAYTAHSIASRGKNNSPLQSVKCDKQCRRRRTSAYRTYVRRSKPH